MHPPALQFLLQQLHLQLVVVQLSLRIHVERERAHVSLLASWCLLLLLVLLLLVVLVQLLTGNCTRVLTQFAWRGWASLGAEYNKYDNMSYF